MAWLLDTDTCVYALKQRPAVLQRFLTKPPSRIFVSVVSEGELRFGAAQSDQPQRTQQKLEAFLGPLQIIPLTSDDVQVYGGLRARLERAGKPIGPLDLFIAAHAVARGLTLVTNNQREFSRVDGLRLENWTK